MKGYTLVKSLACLLILGTCGLATLPLYDTQEAIASDSGSNCADELANCLEAVAEAVRNCLGSGSGNCIFSGIKAAEACYRAYDACFG